MPLATGITVLEQANMAQHHRYTNHKLDKVDLPRRSLETSHHQLLQVIQPKLCGLQGYFFSGLLLARSHVDVKKLEGGCHVKEIDIESGLDPGKLLSALCQNRSGNYKIEFPIL